MVGNEVGGGLAIEMVVSGATARVLPPTCWAVSIDGRSRVDSLAS